MRALGFCVVNSQLLIWRSRKKTLNYASLSVAMQIYLLGSEKHYLSNPYSTQEFKLEAQKYIMDRSLYLQVHP